MSALYRSADLQEDAIGWIENDSEVQTLLGADGDVVPVAIAREVDADPRIAVGTSITTAERINIRDETTFEVRVIVDGTVSFVQSNGSEYVTELKDRVIDVLTTARAEFDPPSVTTDDEVAHSDTLNRYMGVVSVELTRRDTR